MFNPVDSYKYVTPPGLYVKGNKLCYKYTAPLELYLDGNNFAINMSPLWGFIFTVTNCAINI